ncbi:ABC transporter permease [Escherichia coli]|uniref:ABC transporter permease n=1 Tax=Escherichia coli TaxID=562 RepID=A0A447X4Z5_ECOLX|nr:ABC transporter permease [Escherichia coli]
MVNMKRHGHWDYQPGYATPGHYSPGTASDYSAVNQPVSQHRQKLLSCRAIGYPDMVSLFAGTVLNQTGQAIETIAMTMSVYLIISLTISLLMNIYNRRIAIVER